ncbi:MAG: hypothetical protein K8E66_07780, partial [Phycisphaerales bacterium]|nr:hypothetical protein [Phycisphaerales bacterium]
REIERLPGRHLYFLDDHLFGNVRFADALFDGMRGMDRVFQGAATVDSILRGDLVEHAAAAGLRSLFVGFETLSAGNLRQSNKRQNLARDYARVTKRLHDLGIMINGSFVFGLDEDDGDVFDRTVEWGVEQALTTATYHIATPYPGTAFHREMTEQGRILTRDWNLYDTRHVVFRPAKLAADELVAGYHRAYANFYSWRNILRSSLRHDRAKHVAKHLAYTAGWKKFEAVWNFLIRTRHLNETLPVLEAVLSRVQPAAGWETESPAPTASPAAG